METHNVMQEVLLATAVARENKECTVVNQTNLIMHFEVVDDEQVISNDGHEFYK